ncbi:hypothetical protein FOA43_000930 [Brettanomyces nanus]|uniref:Uncharacterized protein n=1 Tax=Eeniella nana TaxID=13502 RepID=A0A875RY58_EENNA|nr:uncharacterized protein FOA43_000930 [Brettanomyces nanus]QPG73618.1 hypothetical protein FOA43_000930 [Brettanomyces nanus]
MKINEQKEQYEIILDDSFKLSQKVVDRIQEVKKGDAKADEELNLLHKEMALDTVKLVKHKNKMKLGLYDLNQQFKEDKVNKSDKQYNNIKLASLKRQKGKNSSMKEKFETLMNELPKFKTDKLAYKDNKFTRSLKSDSSVVKQSIENGRAEEYEITERDVKKFKKNLQRAQKKKFKLVVLNDEYYEQKITTLNGLKMKWESRLEKIRKFRDEAIELGERVGSKLAEEGEANEKEATGEAVDVTEEATGKATEEATEEEDGVIEEATGEGVDVTEEATREATEEEDGVIEEATEESSREATEEPTEEGEDVYAAIDSIEHSPNTESRDYTRSGTEEEQNSGTDPESKQSSVESEQVSSKGQTEDQDIQMIDQ